MRLYRIRNWSTLYENNRTRELKKLDWVPIPNKQDGDGYTLIMEQKDGASIFGAWIACVQIASRCGNPAGRGVLMRDGETPHDSSSLSRMSRIPASIMERMLNILSSPDINWLEYNEFQSKCDNIAPPCDNTAGECLEGKGREGKGIERMEGKETNHPDLPKCQEYFQKNDSGYSTPEVKQVFQSFEATAVEGFWLVGNKRVSDWRAAMSMRLYDNRKRDEKPSNGRPAKDPNIL